MDHAQYLLLMGACVLITLPLEFVLGVRVYRSPRRLLVALAPTFIIFTGWDLVGIARNHWHYSSQFISGIHVGPIPLEELVFFIVVPICGLLTYEAVGKVIALSGRHGPLSFRWPDGVIRTSSEGGHGA